MLGPPAAIGFDPRDTPLIEGALAHLVDQAHALDHITAGTPQIHGLSARANTLGELNDRYAVTSLVQPEGQCRPRDSGSADQDGRRWHGRKGNR